MTLAKPSLRTEFFSDVKQAVKGLFYIWKKATWKTLINMS